MRSPLLPILVFAALIQGPPLSAEEATPAALIPFKSDVNGKIGYIDMSGNVVALPQYDPTEFPILSDRGYAALSEGMLGERFYEGLAAVKVGEKYGYIDTQGKLVIAPQFDAADRFSEGKAAVKIKGQYGYIDKRGEIVIRPQFSRARRFSEGLALAWKADGFIYINAQGETVIQNNKIDDGSEFVGGLAAIRIQERFGYIQQDGNFAVPPQFQWAGPFSGALAPVKNEGKLGYIDRKGKPVIDPIYEDAQPFSEGRALVRKDGLYGYIDESGKVVIPLQFEGARSFSEGLAAVRRLHEQRYEYIDASGKTALQLPPGGEAFSFVNGLALIETGRPRPVPQKGIPFVWQRPWSTFPSDEANTDRMLMGGEHSRIVISYAYINRLGAMVFRGLVLLMATPGPPDATHKSDYFELPLVDVTVDSKPRGAKVYIIPFLLWDETKDPLNSPKLLFEHLRTTPTLYTDRIYQDVYVFVLEHEGKQIILKKDINEQQDRKVYVDFKEVKP